MKANDYFVVFNPDVVVSSDNIKYLTNKMEEGNVMLSVINLHKDPEFQVYDQPIRKFPTLLEFAS